MRTINHKNNTFKYILKLNSYILLGNGYKWFGALQEKTK